VGGKTLVLNGRTFAISGVLRDDFQGPGGLYTPDVWVPLERADALGLPAAFRSREDTGLTVVGRLKDGVTPAQADADLQAVFARLAQDYPASNAKRSAAFHVMADGHPDLRGIAPMAWAALAVVGVVLLIACFNVAGLLLARASERQREIGVRAALGASRGRILRQMLTEGVLLAALSGIAALVLAAWSADLLSAFSLPAPIPQRLQLGLSRRLVEFTLLLVAIAGILPALLPALQATRASLFRTMKVEAPLGSGRSRLRSTFVVAQVAGSTLFLAAALLFVRSFTNAASVDLGFDAAHTLVLELDASAYGYDAPRTRALFDALTARVAALPGVSQAGLADRVPFYVGFPASSEVSADGTDCATADCRRAAVYAVGAGHFAALGVPLRQGRDFTPQELTSNSAAIVSEQMAQQFWPGGNALGQVFRAGPDAHHYQVIGVAADIKHRSVSQPAGATMYRALADRDYEHALTLIVRTPGDPRALVTAVAEQVQALDPDLPARTATTMTERMAMPLWPARTMAGFASICGGLALVLATVGLFGVTYYAVNQRTREFGIRVALGAAPRAVMALVLREGLTLALPGVAIGTLGALAAGRFASRMLFGVSPADPLTFAATAALEAAAALAACTLPAWRATRADPMIALRQD
jgi:predicted permease